MPAQARPASAPGAPARGVPPGGEDEVELLLHRHVRPQREVLEHEPDVPLVGADHVAARRTDLASGDPDFTCVRLVESGDDPQQRRLAAAAGTDEDDEPAMSHVEGQPVEHEAAAEPPGELTNRQMRRRHGCDHLEDPSTPNSVTGTRITAACISASEATWAGGALAISV